MNWQDIKNVIVIGKTGQGKSYFLNLLIQENPKNGPFKVYNSVDSGTHSCQVEERTLKFGNAENDVITMRLIDTPGLFDTKDDPNAFQPDSIKHFRNIEETVSNLPFIVNTYMVHQKQISRVLLVLKVDNKFDEHVKKMLEICKILVGDQLKVCCILTKCQNEYDEECEEEQQILEALKQKEIEWKKKFSIYGIEDVFLFGNKFVTQKQSKFVFINQYFQQQWNELYKILRKSVKTEIKTWNNLSITEKLKVATYFGYTLDNGKKGCVSLNMKINGMNDQFISYKSAINNKIEIQGYQKNNILLGMLHFSQYQDFLFQRIYFQYQETTSFIELTGNHLIYSPLKQQFIRADLLKKNDILLYCKKEQYSQVIITDIQQVILKGYYSPLTNTGQFFGNGILLSCYISPKEFPVSQQVAHFSLYPLVIYRKLIMREQIDNKDYDEDYQASYSQFLEWLFCQK